MLVTLDVQELHKLESTVKQICEERGEEFLSDQVNSTDIDPLEDGRPVEEKRKEKKEQGIRVSFTWDPRITTLKPSLEIKADVGFLPGGRKEEDERRQKGRRVSVTTEERGGGNMSDESKDKPQHSTFHGASDHTQPASIGFPLPVPPPGLTIAHSPSPAPPARLTAGQPPFPAPPQQPFPPSYAHDPQAAPGIVPS
ncbi:hypothetical protein BHM03_00005363 [Ensete ventricosum]|uniref:Uncharacterized protein n=1 Tax=Ensete ventricosum TaxID=4639 RepID=A0A445MB29_ENSVE|nr:hypothetical protein BHM03_00005363 [Ensete ventricosum]